MASETVPVKCVGCGLEYRIKTPYLIHPGCSGTVKACHNCTGGLQLVYWDGQPGSWRRLTPPYSADMPPYSADILYRREFQMEAAGAK